jgi:hypothetical protein
VSISQPPAQGRGKSGAKTGAGPGRPPSTNGRKSGQNGQAQGANRPPAQRNSSTKTAGNRPVNAKTATQKTAGRPGDRQKQSAGGRPGGPRGRGGPAPVQVPSRRPSPTVLGLGAVALVVVIVLVIVLVGVNKSPGRQTNLGTRVPAPASLVATVTSVPESVFSKVGLPAELVNWPSKVTGGRAPLTVNGLPEMIYVGAEYCPFCGAERWSMVMALSKFGTFTGLKLTNSSVTDFAPDTATFSFYQSSYASKYLVFSPYEIATNEPAATGATCNINGYACLDTLPNSVTTLWQSVGGGSFPFMDFGNKVFQSGAGFENQPLALASLTAAQVAAQLKTPSSAVAQAEDGSANYLTAAICTMTGNQPSAVCSAPYIKTAQAKKAPASS